MTFTDKPELHYTPQRALSVCVKTEHLVGDEDEVFFDGPDHPVWLAPEDTDMLDVLVAAKIFTSRTAARKNWRGSIQIPDGWSDYTVGKLHTRIWVLKSGPPLVDDGHRRDYIGNTLVAVDGVKIEIIKPRGQPMFTQRRGAGEYNVGEGGSCGTMTGISSPEDDIPGFRERREAPGSIM